ncbi:MAG: hypothetical protein F6K21_16675 [Symploca sp. SIO2D2]|nr:hypothetical protein [Symploca sp. SIO2D2]
MTRQFSPEEIPAIKIGAIIAYIIVLLFSIWFLESTVCDITEKKDKLSVLFAIFAVTMIIPWLYTKVIIGNLNQIRQKTTREMISKNKTVVNLVQELEALLSQVPQEPDKVQGLLEQLRIQVDNLATSQKRAEARTEVVKWLNKWFNFQRRSIVEESTKIALNNFNKFPQLSEKQKKRLKNGVKKDINECINWLTDSLKFGVNLNTEKLKNYFIIKSSAQPYIKALEYIRDREISKYFDNELEIEELKIYINLLIERL